MKNVSTSFKENIKKYGRQIDALIIYDNTTITKEDINSIVPSCHTSLFKSVMQELEIDSNVEIKKGKKISVKIGVKFENENYEYIEYDDYIVYSCEKQEDTESYKIIAYDKMLESMIDYDLTVTYPITVRNYMVAIFNKLGWSIEGIPASFINSTKEIKTNIHSGINYTYRDVLDELATITGSFIYVKNGIPTLGYITNTYETIDEEYLSQDDVTIGEKYFINSLVFARAEESDNIYRKNDISIVEYGLHEFRIADNQILSTNDRDDYIDELFNYLKTIEFYIFDIKSTGVLFFEIADLFNINVHNKTYPVVLLSDEITVDQDVEEHIYADEPEETETDYKSADTTDKRINKTYILVDKQNQKIESVISNVSEQNQKIAQVTQTVEELNSKISDIADITISAEDTDGKVELERINHSEPIRLVIRPIGENITCLYPRNNLYPSNDLFPLSRKIIFKNTTTQEVFEYELPADLLYYDSDNYDEFILDYDGQSCVVNKKVGYNEDGTTYVLPSMTTISYPYPTIELTDGDYEVYIFNHNAGYIFVRLMAQNIYTTQFATKAEMSSSISQTSNQIKTEVNQKFTNYSTTTEMNSAINQTANEINSTVSKKVGNDEIISKINQTAENITIDASRININGAVSANGNFKIKTDGSIETKNGSFIEGNIELIGNEEQPTFNIYKNNNKSVNERLYATSNFLVIREEQFKYVNFQANGYDPGISIVNGLDYNINLNVDDSGYSSIFVRGSGGYSQITDRGITTPELTQTSLAKEKKNFEKLENALDIINKVDIYKYNLKHEEDGTKKHIGFVIGDNYNYSEEITSVNNDGADIYSLASVCLKAIKEQQELIKNLQEEIKLLKEDKR